MDRGTPQSDRSAMFIDHEKDNGAHSVRSAMSTIRQSKRLVMLQPNMALLTECAPLSFWWSINMAPPSGYRRNKPQKQPTIECLYSSDRVQAFSRLNRKKCFPVNSS